MHPQVCDGEADLQPGSSFRPPRAGLDRGVARGEMARQFGIHVNVLRKTHPQSHFLGALAAQPIRQAIP